MKQADEGVLLFDLIGKHGFISAAKTLANILLKD